MDFSLRRWLHISFLNLLIVAFIGVILRYKIAFAFPYFDQKHLLDGHSHFAFTGWITQALMVFMVQYLTQYKGDGIARKYRWLFYGNLITAYGMLVFFPIEGYGFWSICFSSLSIINSYFFVTRFWIDLDKLKQKNISHLWFKAALLFYAISSLGAFALAYMMANKVIHQNWYLAAVYYFLHFQYNGWFFFASMGLFISKIEKLILPPGPLKSVFWLFFLACIPAYFLSALWMPIPMIIYWLVIVSALAQCSGWIILIKLMLKHKEVMKSAFTRTGRWLLLLTATALSIKLLLQLGSTHPALSQLAFGFRPIVIGYLHLVLLGVISIFILGYTISMNVLVVSRFCLAGIWIFVSGIIINECLLMTQGVTGLSYTIVPWMNEYLLVAACIMFTGLLLFNLNLSNRRS